MQVVSVINYKGGVGKTTLTANLGAELAFRGHKVLLVDLDPQASLTFSFYSSDEWQRSLADDRTIKQWYDTAEGHLSAAKLAGLICSPARVNEKVEGHGGRVDLIPSHLELINIDLDLAAEIGGGTWEKSKANYLRIHRRLADGLDEKAFNEYDIALIDCPPNFNITTKTAIVASSHILIPAKPDYLSTLGITYLIRKVRELAHDYNECVQSRAGGQANARKISEPVHAVVFTMIQHYGGEPIQAIRPYMEQIEALGVPTFRRTLRDNKTLFASAPESGVPAVLSETGNSEIVDELDRLVDEFTTWTGERRV